MSKILSSKEIGWKLRKLRRQAGWSQERLAEQIGVSVQQLQKYESGANKMRVVSKICEGIAVPADRQACDIAPLAGI